MREKPRLFFSLSLILLLRLLGLSWIRIGG